MPILPFPKPADVGQFSVQAGAPQSERSGNAYGVQKWQEFGKIGQIAQNIGDKFISIGAEKQRIADNTAVATDAANNSFQETNNKIVMETDPSGSQLVPSSAEAFDKYMNDNLAEFAKSGASPAAQRARKLQLLQEKKQYLDSNSIIATKMGAVAGARAIDTGITTILNDIGNNGATSREDFERVIKKGEDLIDNTPGPEQNIKEQDKLDLRHQAGILRFNTLMFPKAGGVTKEDLDAIQKDLDDPYWQKQLETTSLEKIRGALAASKSAFAEISVEGQQSPHVNRVAGHPEDYEAELANLLGVDKSGLEGVKVAANQRNVVSDMTRVRFEALAEQAVTGGDELMTSGKAKTREEAEVKIIALQKDLITNPVWGERLTTDQFRSLKDSLQTRKNALDKDWNEIQRAKTSEDNRVKDKAQADVAATGVNFEARMKEAGRIPPEEFQAWMESRLKLGDDNLTASQQYQVRRVTRMQVVLANLGDKPTQAQINAAIEGINTGGSGTGIYHSPVPAGGVRNGGDGGDSGVVRAGRPMRSVPAGTKPLSENDPRLAPVKTADGRTFMIDREHQAQLQGFIRDYEAAGGVIGPNSGTVAGRPGNASLHPIGGAFDLNQVGRGKRAGGKSLPLDVEDKIAAKWGMRSGNHFSNNDNGHFDFGGGGGGRGPSAAGGNYAKRNNPGNLRVTGFTRSQAGFVREEGGFAVFDTVEHGFQAMNSLLDNYAKSGQNTISSIISKWAPPSENDTASYIATVAKKLGIDANQELTAADRTNLVRAMTEVEQGHSVDGSVDVGGGGATTGGRVDLLTTPKTEDQASALAAISIAQQRLTDGLKNNTITYGAAAVGMSVVALDPAIPETFDKRAGLYGAIDQYFGGLKSDQQNPLMQEDVTVLSDLLNSNDSEKMNQVYAAMKRWSPEMQEAAYKQLGQTAPFGAAAGRVYASDRKDIANLAQRGHKLLTGMEDNGVTPQWMNDSKTWFGDLGPVLQGITSPNKGVGFKQVIDAVHFARHGNTPFDAAEYQKDAEDVLGVKFDQVHSANVAIIPGTTGKEWELAIPELDLVAVSLTQSPALAIDPVKMVTDPDNALQPVSPAAMEAIVPIRLSDGKYEFMDTEGNLLQTITHEKTKEYPNGKPQIYVAQLSAEVIHEAAAKAVDRAEATAMEPEKRPPTGYDPTRGPPARVRAGPKGPEPVVEPVAPATPVIPAAPKVITPDREKAIQSDADDYIDVLKRNASITKEYLEQAREDFVRGARAYELGQPTK